MVIHHGQRWIYIGPPKTGSTTLHHFLTSRAIGGLHSGAQHDNQLPPGCELYWIIMTVRHPQTRLLSFYYHRLFELRDHLKVLPRRRVKELEGMYSFRQFVTEWIDGVLRDVHGDAGFYNNLCVDYEPSGVPICWLRQEFLAADLARTGIAAVVDLPCLNYTTHDKWDVYAPQIDDIWPHVLSRIQPDLDRYGYEPLSLPVANHRSHYETITATFDFQW